MNFQGGKVSLELGEKRPGIFTRVKSFWIEILISKTQEQILAEDLIHAGMLRVNTQSYAIVRVFTRIFPESCLFTRKIFSKKIYQALVDNLQDSLNLLRSYMIFKIP